MTSDPRFSRRALTRAGFGLAALAQLGAALAMVLTWVAWVLLE